MRKEIRDLKAQVTELQGKLYPQKKFWVATTSNTTASPLSYNVTYRME